MLEFYCDSDLGFLAPSLWSNIEVADVLFVYNVCFRGTSDRDGGLNGKLALLLDKNMEVAKYSIF